MRNSRIVSRNGGYKQELLTRIAELAVEAIRVKQVALTLNWHSIGTVLLFSRKSRYVKIDMLKSIPKTETTENTPLNRVYFFMSTLLCFGKPSH